MSTQSVARGAAAPVDVAQPRAEVVGSLETDDEVSARIEEAARYVPLERLALSPQCGFASTMEGNRVTPERQREKLELVARVARSVWGAQAPS
jgi:hypothetical protein